MLKNFIASAIQWIAGDSLQRKLILGVISVHAILMTVFVFDLVDRHRDSLHHQSLDQANNLAQTLATNSISWIIANDVVGLEETIQSLKQYPDLRYAMLLTPSGQVLAHDNLANVGLYVDDNLSQSLLKLPAKPYTLVDNSSLIDVAAPVITNGRHIGWARIGIGQERATQGLRIISRNGVFYTLGAILLGILFASWMAGYVTRGLNRLLQVSEQTRLGKRGLRAQLHQTDEIGMLGRGFDAMLDAMEDSEERVRSLMDSTAEGILGADIDGSCIFCNASALRILGFASTEDVLGKNIHQLIHHSHPDGTPYPESECRGMQIVRTGSGISIDDEVFWTAEGRPVPVEYWAHPIRHNGTVTGSVLAFTDITQRKKAENQLRLSAKVFENSHEAIFITDNRNHIISTNEAFSEITGYSAEEAIGKDPVFLKSGEHNDEFYHSMWNALNQDGYWQGEIWNRRKSGEVYPEWLSISTVTNDQGKASYYIGIFADITDRKAADERIRFLAQHDALTNLPNRSLMQDRLLLAIANAQRDGEHVAVLFLDLDHFKTINDSLGHHMGDHLLQQVAARLSKCVRAVDTVSRQGGDEFIIILGQIKTPSSDTAHIAQKILASIVQPYQFEGLDLHITPSIGIAIYPQDGTDTGTLIKNADAAMYHAKENGRNNYQYFTNDLNARAFERLTLENSLRHALEEHDFVLHYQPQFNLKNGKLTGMEALVRWQHADLGLVPPDKFIPIAEECGLIVPLGEWVLQEACRQNRVWQDAGLSALPVAVNLSALQFRQKNLEHSLASILNKSGLEAQFLELELTESLLMTSAEATVEMLNRLKALGLKLSIDDFGTGYSSLSYLKRFPLDKLKIDRTFVRDITTDSDDAAIARAIIAMAHSLRLKVIAEGVETVEQMDFLKQEKCDEMQGYYFSKPLPAGEMEQMLMAHKM